VKEHIFFIIGLIALTDFCDTISQLILKSSINSLDWHINSLSKAFRLIWKLLKTWRIWFGFLLSLDVIIGMLTPPFGYSLFYLQDIPIKKRKEDY